MPNYLEQLRDRTRSVHHSLETLTDSKRLLNGAPNKAHYKKLLKSHLTLHQRVRCHCAAVRKINPNANLLDWPNCRRISALQNDLRKLGEKHLPPEQPEPTTTLGFTIGLLYVCEGSCLGNQQLLAALEKSEYFQNWQAREFFGRCKKDFGPRWQTMLELIEANAQIDNGYNALENGALFAFEVFKRSWVSDSAR